MAHAEEIFRDLLKKIATEQKFANYDLKVTPISSGGANYTSNLFTATISEEEREINVFAKVAAIGDSMRAQMPIKLYDIERFFYTKYVNIFRHLEEKLNIPVEERFRVPIFYGCNDKLYEETIVLENLVTKGFKEYNRFKSVTWEYAVTAITELAKFHALSAAYAMDDPKGFNEVFEDLKFQMDDNNQTKAVWAAIIQKAVDATKDENKEKLKRFLEEDFMGRETFVKLLAPGKLAVIGHGDYRPSNLMHRELEDGSVEVIPVDYQTLRAGCPVVDLLYFIFTGTDKKFRAQYYDMLIDYYYIELCAALTRFGMNPDEKYSRKDFDDELKEKLPFGLGVAVFTLPIVTVEAENAPTVDENMDMSAFCIQKTGDLFPERLNGVVDDFVRWGVI